MNDRAMDNESGFTLLEVLIALSLLLVTSGAVGMALDANNRSYARGESKMQAQQSARHALSTIAREVRMAGYFPENFAATPASPPLGEPVQIATDGAMVLHGDLDDSGSSSAFLYCLDGTTLRRSKAALGDTAAYWCPAGEVLAENVTDLRLTYFDEANTRIPSTLATTYALDGEAVGSAPSFTDVTERGAVRRIVLSMTIARDVWHQEAEVFTIGSEVHLRNVR